MVNKEHQNHVPLVDTVTYRPGAIILYPGKAEFLYRVVSGLVRIHTMDDEGNGLTLRYVRAGEYFGEEALSKTMPLAGQESSSIQALPHDNLQQRHYFAEAVTNCSIDLMNPTQLSAAERWHITQHLVRTLQRAYHNIYRLVGKRLRARIASTLLELRDTELAERLDTGELIIYATHDELAAAVGSVRETVTKVIGELTKEGVITAGYGKIIINNESALITITTSS